jgi:DNA-binding transcriptional LysR family regulator
MKPLRLGHVRSFLAILEAGSIHAAARRLGVSQPGLTKVVSLLERELGVPLLQRSSRGVIPTDYGRVLASRAKVIEAELRLVGEEISQLQGVRSGMISVGLSAGSSLLLTRVLEQFWRRHPDVRVRVVEGGYESTLADLREGRLDFSIAPRELIAAVTDLTVEKLFETAIVPVVRKSHPLRNIRSLRELSDESWVVSGSRIASTNLLEATFAEYKLGTPRIRVQCESFPALFALLSESNLIGILPERLLRISGFQHVLQIVPVKEKFLPSQACLLTRPGTANTPVAKALIREFRRAAKVLK